MKTKTVKSNELEILGTSQKDLFVSMANKIISNYNLLGGNMAMLDNSNEMFYAKGGSSLASLINKLQVIIFDRGDPLSVPVFLNRIITKGVVDLGKPGGWRGGRASLEDTYLGKGHFRNGQAFTLNDKELQAVRMYVDGIKPESSVYRYKDLMLVSSLEESGITWEADDRGGLHNKFSIQITNVATGKKTKFTFWGSVHDYEHSKTTMTEDDLKHALYCFISDGISGEMSFKDFCGEFGYESDSRKAEKIWKACRKQLDKVKKVVTGDIYDLANELND